MARLSNVGFGDVFGRLAVLAFCWHQLDYKRLKYAVCGCSCGKSKVVAISNLGKGTTSCGCLHKQITGDLHRTHGKTGSAEHKAWKAMWQRCTNPNDSRYRWYKDKVPPETWKDFNTFLSDMGVRPEGHTLERVNNDLPYSKDNCAWATPHDQNRNRSSNIFVLFEGKKLCLEDAAVKAGIPAYRVRSRLGKGKWSVEAAFESNKFTVYNAQAN